MRKIVLIIISIILPLSAQAVVPPAITMTTAIQRFSPPFCQEGLKGLAVAIEKCYQTTNDTSVTIDMCVLGDIAIAKILIQEKKADLSILDRKPSDIILDKTIPVAGLDSYLNLASIVKRLQMLSEVPRFYIFRYNVILPYLQHGADPVYKGITEHCKK